MPRPSTPNVAQACLARVGPRSGPPCFSEPPTIVGAMSSARFFQARAPLQPRSAMRVVKGFANSVWIAARAGRPREMMRNVLAQGDNHHARPELRHAKIRRVQKVPLGVVAHLLESGFELLAIVFEDGAEDAPDIFKHDRAGPCDIDQIEGDREQVALVLVPELLASYRKRRTGGGRRPASQCP